MDNREQGIDLCRKKTGFRNQKEFTVAATNRIQGQKVEQRDDIDFFFLKMDFFSLSPSLQRKLKHVQAGQLMFQTLF